MKLASILPLCTALCLAVPAGAQTAPTRDPAKIQAGTYALDPDHTQVVFAVDHLGYSIYRGSFSDVTGTLELDPKNPAASTLKVSIPVSSVATTSPKLTDELKGAEWLDAAKHPTMSFVSTKVTMDGPDKATVTGDFTLHGVTKPVSLQVTLVGAVPNAITKKFSVGFEAKGRIKRSDFGVKTYVPMIGDEVDLTIAGAFDR
ncbi:polyisoprenoid-binding protein [Chelatococcus reniformis]|uniref:Polyisoprenoid-binding protein n=1 Tax=Chelatococcus reniformis TaxID=1494448 RepID=A0A916URU1_9HYPH|nr:YceI family protein [Chelatococcus reniformis]GGC85236.1 polyisoprenoid-binding protein [Chelatococcus reniformis]